MRRLGADCSVVVTKRGNARGAKGAGHRHELGSTGSYREEPECFSGRRKTSCDGTSRMTRECHVRICERLGVRFPGPTRQELKSLHRTDGPGKVRRKPSAGPVRQRWHKAGSYGLIGPDWAWIEGLVAGERVERRLAAVLAADVDGYSRLMGADEVGTQANLKADGGEIVHAGSAAYKGRNVKTTGYGMLIEFASAVAAVSCAIEVQGKMAEQENGAPQKFAFRIGINIGDIIIDGDDIFGDG